MRKKHQNSKKRLRPRLIKLNRLLFVILFSLVIFLTWKVFSISKNSVWDGKQRLTIVVQIEKDIQGEQEISIFSYNPRESSISILMFPGDLKIEAIGGYGLWKVSSLYALGENENKRGGELLRLSIAEYLGTEVEGWIFAKNMSIEKDITIKQAYVDLIIKGFMRQNVKSNLSLRDLLILLVKIRNVLSSRIEVIKLSEQNIIMSVSLPDGSRELITDIEQINKISSNLYIEDLIKQESFTVAVINGTEENGLASKVARKFSNLGADVVSATSVEEKFKSSKILIINEQIKDSATIKHLKRIIGVEEVESNEADRQRADISVILGEDYIRYLNEY